MTKNLKLILGALGIIILAVVVWFFVLSPIRSDISDTEGTIQEEQDLLLTARAKVNAAEATKAEGKKNQARLLELAKMAPASEELPSLLLQIQALADQSGIDFITVSPGEPVESVSGGYLVLPLELEFEKGSYSAVNDFVYRMESLVGGPGRLLAIKSIDLTLDNEEDEAAQTGITELAASIQAYAFVLGETSATAPPTSGGTGGSTESSSDTTEASTEQ
jgi:Tfp pilus assembly protein PilO